MTTPGSSGWRKSLTGAAFTLLVSTFAIYMAIRLIEAMLPVLIAVGLAAAIVYVLRLIHRRRQGW
ncbi:hypothetical protein [Acidithrix sp. C25]|uniref:hypothetical protein n=1 Tax=Acidithrix sp. C25 TaxID=1671482 RepID=UPI00191B8FA1|nr:hypothetical protein [Acidithrix sp. C25]